MKQSELKEYIKKYIQEKTYAGASAVDDIEKDPDYKRLPSNTKMDVKTRLKKGETATLEAILDEDSQTVEDALSKTYMYLDAISDRVIEADPDSPEAQEVKGKIDSFNDNVLKPIFSELI